ncbi:WASH complex subunit 5 [Eumeta japonica]|uniref:WASH complex subunit 5 n=1 Tax=Eumeta variegata TaxID=151549 RepID=A0A4C1V813_EUMVA|nr:WASH complex subunit 5 [Eumeta japonica]
MPLSQDPRFQILNDELIEKVRRKNVEEENEHNVEVAANMEPSADEVFASLETSLEEMEHWPEGDHMEYFKNREIVQKYHDVVLDFSYFKISDSHEKKISINLVVYQVVEKLRILRTKLDQEVLRKIHDRTISVRAIKAAMGFFNNTIHQILKQERLYPYHYRLVQTLLSWDYTGSILPGLPVRERLLVAFYRYSTSQSQSNVDDVCKLLRDTGYNQIFGKRPADYPVEYFGRIQINYDFIEKIIAKLRSEDIYNQLVVYSIPEHRSAALATQGSMFTAELEHKVREVLNRLLDTRTDTWIKSKNQALEATNSLSELFSSSKPITKIPENEQLKLWFDNISKQISSISDHVTAKSMKKIRQLIQALDEVEEFHGIKNVSTVLQLLSECKDALKNSLRIASLKEEFLVTLETVADVSYAWCTIDSYTKYMQDSIKENPAVTSRLKALFLKLASAMEIPLLRINQAQSEDLVSVSQYYSNELIKYIQKVLQVIPEMVFNIVEKIIELQTWTIKEIPTKLEKEKLRDYAQLNHRLEVAKLTHSASTFTTGILDMKSTLVGVIRVDPAELLEEGLLKELSTHMNKKFENLLEPQTKKGQANTNTLLPRLQKLAESMAGYKRFVQLLVRVSQKRLVQEKELQYLVLRVVLWAVLLDKCYRLLMQGDLISKKVGENIDGYPLLIGLYTLLCQSQQNNIEDFLDCLCTYVRAWMLSGMNTPYPKDANGTLLLRHRYRFVRLSQGSIP